MSGEQVMSARFANACRNERKRLERKRSKLMAAVESIDDQVRELEALAPGELSPPTGMRGREIRDVAVRLLRADRGTAPIHYRDWLRLVEAAGYKVAGKRPDSVFLNQATRSPEVRATTTRGFYQLRP